MICTQIKSNILYNIVYNHYLVLSYFYLILHFLIVQCLDLSGRELKLFWISGVYVG